MDESKFLILVFQSGSWLDKTKEISSIVENGSRYEVYFGRSDKMYAYGKGKVQYFDQPIAIELNKNLVRFKNKGTSKWNFALSFKNYVCLFNDKEKRIELTENIELVPNIAEYEDTKRLIEYYYFLAKSLENKTPHLNIYYEKKLGTIQPECAINNFVTLAAPKHEKLTTYPIFPFGINLSQQKAVINALESQISLIQGPPGTGKTQTILNIITNIVMQGKNVAVVAGNNSAIDNVFEKLEKEQISFIAARLGNKDSQQQFFTTRWELPELKAWSMESSTVYHLKEQLNQISSKITELLEANNMLATLKENLVRLNIEKQYFDKHFDIRPLNIKRFSFFTKWNTPNLLNFLADFKYHSQFEKLNWLTKFKWLYRYKIYRFGDLKLLNENIFKSIISEYYHRKTTELSEEINILEQLLANESFESLLKRQSELSNSLFKSFIAQKYQSIEDTSFNENSYKRNRDAYECFLNQYPVVLSTTDSIINNKSENELFDYLIVDEASQVDLLTGFLSLSCAKNIVVVGDLQQLPHIPDDSLHDDIDRQFSVINGYSYFHESLLSSLDKLFPSVPKTLLKEHYRCHPRIIDFCNQKYYDGKLIAMTSSSTDPFRVIKTEKGNHARKPPSGSGFINIRELDVINNEVLSDELELSEVNEIGFISPYRAQADQAASRLAVNNIAADTVHKFQGREKESIIFSATANTLTKYMDKPNLLNVAVSRAKKRFTLVTSQNVLKKQGSNIGDLLRHIEYQSLSPCIFQSKTVSIFDCLYKEYSDALTSFMKRVKRTSDYLSEDLMSTLLDDILSKDPFSSFSYQKNYALALLIGDLSMLDIEERRFASHPNSHIDFLLFNKLDMQPILAIEVDGYSFHELNKQQKIRDNYKNNILAKISLPLLRLSTTESGEQDKIESALKNILEIS
ncbi:AAA domain-containing protein [Flocculibacter collagenilyticus]|uniref:AAA domain-containing protein n=1 Tax=Flocculibacter collagenilyticus TaxID=2744479 RepID=UPI0018F7A839|nr:AAA domain-containing protein [Flocculibacter collagenilyticus]